MLNVDRVILDFRCFLIIDLIDFGLLMLMLKLLLVVNKM